MIDALMITCLLIAFCIGSTSGSMVEPIQKAIELETLAPESMASQGTRFYADNFQWSTPKEV